MIHIVLGHERGIGTEIFIKSFALIPKLKQDLFSLHTTQDCLDLTFKPLKINYTIKNGFLYFQNSSIKIFLVPSNTNLSITLSCLQSALNHIEKNDILLTMPSSKDQFIENGKHCSGYTEYFRQYFKLPNLSMLFYSEKMCSLLLSDHIPLKEVSKLNFEQLIREKLHNVIYYEKSINTHFKNIYFAGINPHAGENGLIGNEDSQLTDSIEKLKYNYHGINFHGPISGDALHQYFKKDNLIVYTYHDQGLGIFKALNQYIGLNITLGLPFLRMSVDHGTAFELYGKNKAFYMSCFYLLTKAIEFHKN